MSVTYRNEFNHDLTGKKEDKTMTTTLDSLESKVNKLESKINELEGKKRLVIDSGLEQRNYITGLGNTPGGNHPIFSGPLGNVRSEIFSVTFNKKFDNKPKIILSISAISARTNNLNIDVDTAAILNTNKKGFDISIVVAGQTQLEEIWISWLAYDCVDK